MEDGSMRFSMDTGVMMFFSIVMSSFCMTGCVTADPQPLPHAFAHNDYRHPRPLMDALDLGYCNIEADIHLKDGVLLVGHDPEDLRADQTLRDMYIEPLRRRAQNNGGDIFQGIDVFRLFIDIKTEALPTYLALESLLKEYPGLWTEYRDGKVIAGAVTVIVSGNRPIEYVRDQKQRLAFLDGRLSDLGSRESPGLFPVISDNWTDHFTWNGEGEMPSTEQEQLQKIVSQVHSNQQVLRFWDIPTDGSAECRRFWAKMMDIGVDLINTDNLSGFAAFSGG
jgi:hypothetical protein